MYFHVFYLDLIWYTNHLKLLLSVWFVLIECDTYLPYIRSSCHFSMNFYTDYSQFGTLKSARGAWGEKKKQIAALAMLSYEQHEINYQNTKTSFIYIFCLRKKPQVPPPLEVKWPVPKIKTLFQNPVFWQKVCGKLPPKDNYWGTM